MQIDQNSLAIAVAAATFVFLGVTMLVLTIDVRLAHQIDEANAQIAALAREDSLTGLANRRTFLEHLDSAFSTFGRTKAEFAVQLVDLDGFKEINDTLGHAAGDSLIVEIARRLKAAVRRDDLVARFGGDEFAILQTNIANPSDIGTLAEKIGAAVAEAHAIGHDEVSVTASVGIAKVSSDTPSTSDLMVQADMALYRAKDDGRNRYRVHDSFAIADFGSGLSAIGCLAETPVQRLKISKDMVARALSNISSAKAVRMIVSIGREVGAEIIADGVATQAQATFLLAAGCEQAQGPFFGPLLSAMEATLLLRDADIERGPSRVRKSSAA